MLDENETIRQVAAGNATGYVATPHGPMSASVCRVLASLDDPDPGHAIVEWHSDWFMVAKLDGLDDYRFIAATEGGERAAWQMKDGIRDVACKLEDVVELHALLGRIIAGSTPGAVSIKDLGDGGGA